MTNIERNVMASVAVIYIVRKLISPLALQWYALVLSVMGIALFVSVPHVAQNFQAVASGGISSILAFIFSAIISTTLVVQAWLLLGSAAIISLFLRVARSFTSTRAALA